MDLLMPAAEIIAFIRRAFTVFYLSGNWGLQAYPGDEVATTIAEYRTFMLNMVAMTTMEYFTAIFWVPHHIFSLLIALIENEWGTKCDYYVWTKAGKYGKQGLWITPVTELAVVGYYSTTGSRRPSHFSPQETGTIRSNHINLPVVSNKSRTVDENGASVVVNSTEMNVGVPMVLVTNHSNKGEWICDMCTGSGSGTVAPLLLGRHVVAIDIREEQVCVLFFKFENATFLICCVDNVSHFRLRL
jgi:hypothetical protein